MRHGRWSILVFAFGVTLLTGALVWLTMQAVALERSEARARAEAKFQEAIRLALWRMESTLAPIIARESARPYFQYRSFYPADRAYNAMRSDVKPGEIVVPSPLLAGPEDPILLHFEQDARGVSSSPQVPGPEYVGLAESTYASQYDLALWKQRLGEFTKLNDVARRATFGAAMDVGSVNAIFDAAGNESGPLADAMQSLPPPSRMEDQVRKVDSAKQMESLPPENSKIGRSN